MITTLVMETTLAMITILVVTLPMETTLVETRPSMMDVDNLLTVTEP